MNSKNVARVLLVILLVTTVHSAIASNSHSVVVYFYGECPRCVSYVKAFERDFSAVGITDIEEIDYSRDATGLEALRELRERLHVPQEFFRAVTTVIDKKYVFEGYFPIDIMTRFVVSDASYERLIAVEGIKPNTYRLFKDNATIDCSSADEISECVTSGHALGAPSVWALVLAAGLIDGINPCAFSVLIYFVGVVALSRKRKQILGLGLTYILSVYLVYFGIGLGLIGTIQWTGFARIVARFLGASVVGIAALNLAGTASRRISKFSTRIYPGLFLPIAARFNSSWIQRSAPAAALLFGGMIAVIEFPCTGGVYAAIIGILSVQKIGSVTLLYLLGYNLMFITPLVALLILSYKAVDLPSLGRAVERRKTLARLMSGLVMLGLGISLLIS